ncbi:MAG: leucine-rich repeat protein [Ruminococcus sp.]|nr:leucine-rich repeat protein [Ruminococcus sp.]
MKSRRIKAFIAASAILAITSTGFMPFNSFEMPILTASAADIVASGECGAEGDNILWEFDSEGKLTISGTGKMADWSFQQPWSDNAFKVVTAEISDGITYIGDYAFNNCMYMTSVSIPDSVSSIGEYAFNNCTKITSISIPNTVTSIGQYAFFDCQSLTSITIPDSVTVLETSVFYDCFNLTSVTLSENVESIKFGAFQNCKNLDSVTIANPNCQIYDYNATICNSFDYETDTTLFSGTIYGYEGSTAQAYAEKYNKKFAIIGAEKPAAADLGDVNADGSVDASDASLVLAEYAKIQTGGTAEFTDSETKTADVNNDTVVDASDASKILAYYAMVSTGKEPTWS